MKKNIAVALLIFILLFPTFNVNAFTNQEYNYIYGDTSETYTGPNIHVPAKAYLTTTDDGGYFLYNQNSSIVVLADHDEIVRGVYPIRWVLQKKSGPSYLDLSASSVEVSQVSAYSVKRRTVYSDNSILEITYSITDTTPIKISAKATAGVKANYQLKLRVEGLIDDNTGQILKYNLDTANKRITITAPPYLGNTAFTYMWGDVSVNLNQNMYADGVFEQYFSIGQVGAGVTVTFDPSTVTTTAGQYATAYGNSRHLIRDAYGNLIYVGTNTNLVWAYCNDPPSGSWTSEDLGATYAVSTTAGEGTCSIAYDSTNDKLMIAWVDNSSPNKAKCVQMTFSRNGNNDITGKTLSSVLTLTLANAKAARRPSLYMLHNGEVGLVVGDNSVSGAKSGTLEGCRVVFGNPPTYKNFAGTASTMTKISTTYTGAHTTHIGALCERTNSGTGQYDIWFVWKVSFYVTKTKNKGTWSSPNWSVSSANEGDTSAAPTGPGDTCPSMAYDSINNLILYSWYGSAESLAVGKIDASDTDTDIGTNPSPSPNELRSLPLTVVNSQYYVYYQATNYNVYHVIYSGSWGSPVQDTSTNNENFPSVSLTTTDRIDYVWTHYNGADYDVYYSSLSLGAVITETPISKAKAYDAMSRTMTWVISPISKAKVYDSMFRTVTVTVPFLDKSKAYDTLYRTISVTLSNGDKAFGKDSLSITFTKIIELLDKALVNDKVYTQYSLQHILGDLSLAYESIQKQLSLSRLFIDKALGKDDISAQYFLNRIIGDYAKGYDSLISQITIARSFIDKAFANDKIFVQYSLERTLQDIAYSYDSMTREISITRNFIDKGKAYDSLVTQIGNFFEFIDKAIASDVATAQYTLERIIADIAKASDNLIIQLNLQKTFSDFALAYDQLQHQYAFTRTFLDKGLANDRVQTEYVLNRMLGDIGKAYDVAIAQYTLTRSFIDKALAFDSFQGFGQYVFELFDKALGKDYLTSNVYFNFVVGSLAKAYDSVVLGGAQILAFIVGDMAKAYSFLQTFLVIDITQLLDPNVSPSFIFIGLIILAAAFFIIAAIRKGAIWIILGAGFGIIAGFYAMNVLNLEQVVGGNILAGWGVIILMILVLFIGAIYLIAKALGAGDMD